LNQLVGLTGATGCSISAPTSGAGGGSTTTTTPTTTTPGTATTTTLPPSTTIPPAAGSKQQLLDQAAAKLDQAQTALDNKDLGTYQRLVEEARTLVKQAQQKP
jgi:hypothetical protein